MGHREIKDRLGNVRAILREQPSGWAELFDVGGGLLGRYDPHLDQTFDGCGVLVGPGNQLLALL